MIGKIVIGVAGGAVGYVLGAKAGRGRYDQIREQASRVWRDPRVQQKASQAAEGIKDTAQQAKDKSPVGQDTGADNESGTGSDASSGRSDPESEGGRYE